MTLKKAALIVGITLTIALVAAIVFLTYKTRTKRPQEPQKPYPYHTEEVTFPNNQGSITLAGTLTLPEKKGKYPAVILISGSGPQNRDEEISGHRPFLVIADHLTRQGVAVLRYDDRGVGQSTGDFKAATIVDFASDAASALEYLKNRKEIDRGRIGLIGHSEGAMVAPMVASGSTDVSFMVMLAGPGIKLVKIMMMQQELIARADGVSESDIKEYLLPVHRKAYQMMLMSTDSLTLKSDLAKFIEETYDSSPVRLQSTTQTKEEIVATQSDKWSSEYYRNFLKYDPAPVLEKVSCPVLALNGEKDLQVTPKENLAEINNALKRGGNTNVMAIELPNLNHLFQHCETGSPREYGKIEETFSPIALKEISDWVLKQVN